MSRGAARGDEAAQAVFGTALGAASVLWWAGCWFRAACVAGMWVLLAVARPDEPLRAVVQLGLTSAGVALAFLHTRSGALERLLDVRLPSVRRLAAHLLGTSGRATLDASGAAEIVGVFLALWLFTGVLPLPGLTPAQRVTGIVLGVLYALSAALQGMIDPGWYSVDSPPAPALRRLRPVLPLVFAGMLAGYLYPYNDSAAQLTVPGYLALCATPLGYYPLWGAFDATLRAAAGHAVASHRLWRRGTAVDMHSIARNAVSLLQQYADEPDPQLREVRRLVREAMMQVEEARQDVLSGEHRRGPRAFGELWDLVMRTLPATRRERCASDEDSARTRLSPVDYQIARRVLPDLLTNALNAGADRVEVRCSTHRPGRVLLTATDDGPGVDGEPAADGSPYGSSRVLRHWLATHGGDIRWRSHHPGTTVEVCWQAQSAEGD
ncbi:ATP-binding protein [Streptomyces sp. NPDC092296]|uniref:ATP-binding protein n=1 Tax=Streptomyces sp. NPDC092296 TaxID=3366012 RepID=UPI0038031F8D